MKDTTIAFVTFIVSIFVIIQIKIISKIRKIKMTNGKITANNSLIASSCYCDDCCDCICCLGELSTRCIDACFGEQIDEQVEKRADRKAAAAERRISEKREKEQEKYLTEIEQEKIGRNERVEVLRVSNYTAAEKDRHKVIELVSDNPKTNLPWTSTSVRLPIEEIILIIENEPDFEVKGEYIINKKKIQEKEEKIKIAKITCPNCENLFELGSDFCPNCGDTLET